MMQVLRRLLGADYDAFCGRSRRQLLQLEPGGRIENPSVLVRRVALGRAAARFVECVATPCCALSLYPIPTLTPSTLAGYATRTRTTGMLE